MIQMDDLEQVLNWNRFSIPILRQDSACRVLSCITLSIMAKIAVISLIKWEMTWGFRIRMSHPLVVNIFFLSSQLHDSFWKLRQKKKRLWSLEVFTSVQTKFPDNFDLRFEAKIGSLPHGYGSSTSHCELCAYNQKMFRNARLWNPLKTMDFLCAVPCLCVWFESPVSHRSLFNTLACGWVSGDEAEDLTN